MDVTIFRVRKFHVDLAGNGQYAHIFCTQSRMVEQYSKNYLTLGGTESLPLKSRASILPFHFESKRSQ